MDNDKVLEKIFENDPFGLLNIKPISSARNEDERLISSFQEINDFYKKNNREPEPGGGVQEHILYSRLKSIRENETKIEMLVNYDTFGFLKFKKKEINSVDDVLNDDSLHILDLNDEGIFDLKHVNKIKERENAEFVARRKPCKNFAKYEFKFKKCQSELKDGTRKLTKFHENQIQENAFFALNGVLVYVDKLLNITVDKFGKRDGRTKLIFENGTESNMLFRSLGKGLFQNGQGVSFTNEDLNTKFIEAYENITTDDKEAGFIYILSSQSDNIKIKSIDNLYKIGYSKIPVIERIKNAEQDPTYLMAGVKIKAAYKCYNMNPQKLELLLHNFFGSSCLNIDIFDKAGNRHIPREWFIAPIDVIEQAIHFIITGEISEYKYDARKEKIVER